MNGLIQRICLFCLSLVFMTACSPALFSGSGMQALAYPTLTLTFTRSTLTQTPYPSPTLTITPTNTSTPLPTFTPTITYTPSPTLTATWIYQPAGNVQAPILLYHHIAESASTNRYYVSPEAFRQQMEALAKWGYTSITPTQLREVILQGGELPARPVIITFDDGNLSVYQNAFPVMQEFGFIGAVYLVANYLNAVDFLTSDQIIELMNSGWEIGSHGASHIDLTKNQDSIRVELIESRKKIEEIIGVPVTSFAYPFGSVNEFVLFKTQDYGYISGMGLGTSTIHTAADLFYLNRLEIKFDIDLERFASLLPWSSSIP